MRVPAPSAMGVASPIPALMVSQFSYEAYRVGVPGKISGATVAQPASSSEEVSCSPATAQVFSSATTM